MGSEAPTAATSSGSASSAEDTRCDTAGRPPQRMRGRATALQLDALLDVAEACTTAGVIELTVDVARLDLTDPPTRWTLVAVATALRSSNGHPAGGRCEHRPAAGGATGGVVDRGVRALGRVAGTPRDRRSAVAEARDTGPVRSRHAAVSTAGQAPTAAT